MPKQFLQIFNKKSLFSLTLERNLKICSQALVVSNEEQYFLALEQAQDCLKDEKVKFYLETSARNTAAAITLACLSLEKDEIVLVTPSDHLIKNETSYQELVKKAQEFAKSDNLVTFGIMPSYAETGYGYIKSQNIYEVEKFIEKPSLQKAQEFLKEGNYFWNSGMFCFRVGYFLEQMQTYAKEIYEASMETYHNALKMSDFIKFKKEDMEQIPILSIDYALMEKAKDVKVIPSDMGWSDVGSFESLSKEFQADESGNYTNVMAQFLDSKNIFCLAEKKKFIATIDLEDLFIIDTQDALLVGKKTSAQKVKNIYESIKSNSSLSQNHLTTYRPWGSFTILEDERGYKIKRIEVKPGRRLSLQKHMHRNEHWIVLSGTASVEIEGKESLVRPNESIYIKMGQTHRLSNYGKIPIVMIEAQVGEYTGEDDIVRIEDDYKRN